MFHRSEEGLRPFSHPIHLWRANYNTSLVKVFLSSIANTFVKEFLGVQGIHTVSSFFRLYRASAIKKLQSYYGERIIEKDGFECMLEMLMKMINLNISISEVPMVLDTKKRLGKSKMKIIKTIFAYFTLWVEKKKWQEMVIAPPKDLLEHRKCAEDLP
jgi:dolichol-phosphate mannosyltransferase